MADQFDLFSDLDDDEIDDVLDDGWYNTDNTPKKEEVKCICGCDAVYGPKNTLHCDYCPKRKK